jgi:hypothetical protein
MGSWASEASNDAPGASQGPCRPKNDHPNLKETIMNAEVYIKELKTTRRDLNGDPGVPNTREKSLALTKIDEAIMWLEKVPDQTGATRPS